MTRAFKLSALLACLILGWTAPLPGQDPRIQRAREEMKEARKTLDTAREDLERVYMELEEEFTRIHGPYAAQYLKGLDTAWLSILPDIDQDLRSQRSLLGSRRKFSDYVSPLLYRAAVTKVLAIDERILNPFIGQASALIYDHFKKGKTLEEGDLESQLSDTLSTGVYFHDFWNSHLYQVIEEAQDFADANAAFDEARTDLDRLEHPERYTSRGKRAPSRMVYVPAGFYTVGPNTGWERPRRKITVREFYIDTYEITNQEYNEFLKDQDPNRYNDFVPYFWPRNKNMERVYPEERASEPVMGVSWVAAHAYAQWCGKRLPTEVEWEVAARGKQGFAFPWGNQFDASLCNTAELGFNDVTEVGSFPDGVSPFGCMDMAGNVYEWTCTDQDGNRIEEFDDEIRNMVIRSGDYRESADHARGDFRWMTPMDPYAGRNPTKKRIGFRCVKEVK